MSMSKRIPQTRITAFVDAEVAGRFDWYTTAIGLSKNTFLNATLPAELGELEGLPPNGAEGGRSLKLRLKIQSATRSRLNITLERSTADRMNEVCARKRIPRDLFLDAYLRFLVDGDPAGSCIGPLVKVAAVLENPRHEYYSYKGHGPYEDLSLSDEALKMAEKAMRELDNLLRNS